MPCTSATWTSNRFNMFGYRPGLLLSDFQINTSTFTTTVNAQQVIGANPDRYGVYFGVSTSNSYICSPVLKGFTQTTGLINVQNVPFPVTFPDYGPLVCLPWWVIWNGVGVTVMLFELIYKPIGGVSSVAKISTLADTIMGASATPQLEMPLPKYVPQVPTVPPLSYPVRRSGPSSLVPTPMSR